MGFLYKTKYNSINKIEKVRPIGCTFFTLFRKSGHILDIFLLLNDSFRFYVIRCSVNLGNWTRFFSLGIQFLKFGLIGKLPKSASSNKLPV